MPSPLAHVGAALALLVGLTPRGGWPSFPTLRGPAWGRVAAACACASVAPDLDIAAALLFPSGLDWHRGPTHSLLGATLIGLGTALLFRVGGLRARVVVIGGALLHVPFDWSTGEPGAPAHYGVPWAWPLSSEKYLDSTPWFGAFRIDEAGFLANMVAPHALPVYLGELVTVGVLLAVAVLLRRFYFGLSSTNS